MIYFFFRHFRQLLVTQRTGSLGRTRGFSQADNGHARGVRSRSVSSATMQRRPMGDCPFR